MNKSNCNSAEIIEVIRVVTCVGSGTEPDPYREVTSYWTKDGNLIFRKDVWANASARKVENP